MYDVVLDYSMPSSDALLLSYHMPILPDLESEPASYVCMYAFVYLSVCVSVH